MHRIVSGVLQRPLRPGGRFYFARSWKGAKMNFRNVTSFLTFFNKVGSYCILPSVSFLSEEDAFMGFNHWRVSRHQWLNCNEISLKNDFFFYQRRKVRRNLCLDLTMNTAMLLKDGCHFLWMQCRGFLKYARDGSRDWYLGPWYWWLSMFMYEVWY